MFKEYLDTTPQRYPQVGDRVQVLQKENYASGELTKGMVKKVLTKKRFHPRGHKVLLESGVIGRVQSFADKDSNPMNFALDPNELR